MPSAEDLKYLRMTPQELELAIGGSLVDDSFGAKAATDAEKQSAANAWFSANMGRFRHGVCGNDMICKQIFGKDKQDRNVLFGTVIDTLAKLGGFPVPIAAIAAKLIHYGLNQLCADFKAPEP